jgi:hypothetical protein
MSQTLKTKYPHSLVPTRMLNGDVVSKLANSKKNVQKLEQQESKFSTGVLWLLFFIIIYLILFIKALTFESVFNDLFFGFYSILITSYILSRFIFSYLHKPVAYNPAYEPTVTFVVPAKMKTQILRKQYDALQR